MLTRRRFLGTGLAASSLALPAVAKTKAPSAFSHLKSRAAEATPISSAEYAARQDQARKLMADQGLDAVILAEGTSLTYFTGAHWWGSERLFAAVIPAKGKPFFVCPAFEEARAREQVVTATASDPLDVRVWQEDQNPYELLAQGLSDRGIATARIGIEENVRFVFADGIARAAPQTRLVSATPVTAGCRMIKSDHEIALMRLASEVTLAAYEATWQQLKLGMSPQEITALSAAAHQALGFEGAADLVLIGPAASFPHGSRQPTTLRENSLVLFDGGCSVLGYKSDISRTFVLGRPTDRMHRVFDTVLAAQSAALAAARPGAACGSIDAAARAVVDAAGFGPDYAHFTHRVGHGMGMDGHEWPYLVRGNDTRLARGMTTSNEPGIYLPGEFGVRLEDDMHITESGAELFTPQSRSLERPFDRT
jgi:Xaa-Pro dipeptidase